MLLYKYTDTEIKKLLKSLIIICDTREQKHQHITSWFDEKNIKHISKKLDHGDYSCYLPADADLGITRDMYFTNIISIERKANLTELSGNLTQGRAQFESELIRAKGKLCLLIENSTYGHIVAHNYNTQYKPSSFIASLATFEARYNITVTHLPDNKYSASYIYQTLVYHVRERLKNG